jgi:dTDP-4-amino-4,6-dideoxygalactose transaminase
MEINSILKDIPCIIPVKIREGCTHSFYCQGFKYDNEKSEGIRRDTFINAVIAELSGEEGRPDRPMLGCGYIKPLYKLPLFTNRGYNEYLPVVEDLWKHDFFLSMYHNLPLGKDDVQSIGDAFHKVWENRGELKCV